MASLTASNWCRVISGFGYGTGSSNALTVSIGMSTTYRGTVGDLDPQQHSGAFFDYQMFVRTHHDTRSGQHFQVIDYWVDPTP